MASTQINMNDDAAVTNEKAGELWRASVKAYQPVELLKQAYDEVMGKGGDVVRCDIFSAGFEYKFPIGTVNPLGTGTDSDEMWAGLEIVFVRDIAKDQWD